MDNQVKTNRSRLISLAYEALNHMEMPPEGTSDAEMLLLLSRAILDKAPEAGAPKEWEGTFMFSKLDDVRARSFLRRLH
jgi:hypothetical protein